MSPSAPPRGVRYHLQITYPSGPHQVVLEAEDVIAWVAGFAAALGQQEHLTTIGAGPEDTRRVQSLQIGDAQGWFTYLYPDYPTTEG